MDVSAVAFIIVLNVSTSYLEYQCSVACRYCNIYPLRWCNKYGFHAYCTRLPGLYMAQE